MTEEVVQMTPRRTAQKKPSHSKPNHPTQVNEPTKKQANKPTPATETFLLRFRKNDSLGGISKKTVELLSEVTGLTSTDLIHRALLNMAATYLPAYELDDGPLTNEQITEIRSLSTASDLTDESFDQRLF